MKKQYCLVMRFICAFCSCLWLIVAAQEWEHDAEQQMNHRFLVREEQFRMQAFLKRLGIVYQQIPTGIFYFVTIRGIGPRIASGDVVFLDYRIKGLDGTLYYQNKFEEPMELIVGKYGAESGINQALTYLQLGSKATVLLPSYLAHGLLGDRLKIPALMPIIWEIHVLNVLPRESQ